MQTQTNYTGIDISKAFFDVAIPQEGKYKHYKFSNDEHGFKALCRRFTHCDGSVGPLLSEVGLLFIITGYRNKRYQPVGYP